MAGHGEVRGNQSRDDVRGAAGRRRQPREYRIGLEGRMTRESETDSDECVGGRLVLIVAVDQQRERDARVDKRLVGPTSDLQAGGSGRRRQSACIRALE